MSVDVSYEDAKLAVEGAITEAMAETCLETGIVAGAAADSLRAAVMKRLAQHVPAVVRWLAEES